MIALEVIGSLVVAGILLTATWMAIVGLLSVIGAVRLHRCAECGHLVTTSPGRAGPCGYCRHPRLAGHLPAVHLRHRLPGDF